MRENASGLTGLSEGQLDRMLAQFGSEDDALLASMQEQFSAAEPRDAASALRALMRSLVAVMSMGAKS